MLSKDYMTVTVEDIGGIHSLFTMVGGRIVYADKLYPGSRRNSRAFASPCAHSTSQRVAEMIRTCTQEMAKVLKAARVGPE